MLMMMVDDKIDACAFLSLRAPSAPANAWGTRPAIVEKGPPPGLPSGGLQLVSRDEKVKHTFRAQFLLSRVSPFSHRCPCVCGIDSDMTWHVDVKVSTCRKCIIS